MSELGQMHHEEVGQWDEPPESIPLQVRSSSPSFMGSIIVTETECN